LTYWQDRKLIEPKMYKMVSSKEFRQWGYRLAKLIPSKSSVPINFVDFAQELENQYSASQTKMEDIMNETFFHAQVVPPTQIDVVIKCPEIPGVSYLRY
jgi:hypothetical protein